MAAPQPWPTDAAPYAGWDRRLERLVPYVFAATTGFQVLKYVISPVLLGFDARLYAAASRAWLEGADPWQVADHGIYFAAPPPTLIAFAPFAYLPPGLTSAVWVVGSFAAAAAAIRWLGRPIWWLAFWPIVDGALVGNPDVLVFALLVVAGGRFGALAAILKVYAIAPLVTERRVRQLAIIAAFLLVTAVVLPWRLWIDSFGHIVDNLASISLSTSVFGEPLAMALGVIALFALGVRRAGWLAVPLLWPHTQVHYLAMSVPMLTPMLAIAWCFPHPAVVLLSTVAAAIGYRAIQPTTMSLRTESAR